MVGTLAITTSKDADVIRRWTNTVTYGKTSLIRTPARASTRALLIERYTKTCDASSTMYLTAPWPKIVLFASLASRMAPQFQAREAQQVRWQGKPWKLDHPLWDRSPISSRRRTRHGKLFPSRPWPSWPPMATRFTRRLLWFMGGIVAGFHQ